MDPNSIDAAYLAPPPSSTSGTAPVSNKADLLGTDAPGTPTASTRAGRPPPPSQSPLDPAFAAPPSFDASVYRPPAPAAAPSSLTVQQTASVIIVEGTLQWLDGRKKVSGHAVLHGTRKLSYGPSECVDLTMPFHCAPTPEEEAPFGFSILTSGGVRHVFVAESAVAQGRWLSALSSLDVLIGNAVASARAAEAERALQRDMSAAFQPPTMALSRFVEPAWARAVDAQLQELVRRMAADKSYRQRVPPGPTRLGRNEGGLSGVRACPINPGIASMLLSMRLPALADPAELDHLAARARSLRDRIEHVIGVTASGANGSNGRDGSSGSHGASGGYGGGHGSSGGPGGSGEHGTPGQHGNDAGLFDLRLVRGNARQLEVVGSFNGLLSFDRPLGMVLVDAKGGDGGHGGHGGDGGPGGSGGAGGTGTTGTPGHDAFSAGQNGGNGGPGGPGGNGGHGGNGGRGGDGAHGGNAGAGGTVIVASDDPQLFALLVCDARAGFPGDAGRGGHGGAGGAGGHGGSGGAGGRGGHGGPSRTDREGHVVVHAGHSGMSGSTGRSGSSGSSGSSGASGHDSSAGSRANAGSLSFVVLDRTGGQVLEAGGRCFEATVSGFCVSTAQGADDCVFEPGEKIVVTNITIFNAGDITLPAGACLTFASTPTTTFDEHLVVLPPLAPGQSYCSDAVVSATLFDVPSPLQSGLYRGTAVFQSQVTLLERPFASGQCACEIDVHYPVQLEDCVAPTQMAIGEHNTLSFVVRNVGTLPLAAKAVEMRIEMGSVLVPSGFDQSTIAQGVIVMPVPLDAKVSKAAPVAASLCSHTHIGLAVHRDSLLAGPTGRAFPALSVARAAFLQRQGDPTARGRGSHGAAVSAQQQRGPLRRCARHHQRAFDAQRLFGVRARVPPLFSQCRLL